MSKSIIRKSDKGKSLFAEFGVWWGPNNTIYIALQRDGDGPGTGHPIIVQVSDKPESRFGHRTLHKHLAKLLQEEGITE